MSAPLITRLEKAAEGSDELSANIMMLFRAPAGRVEQSAINGAWCVYEASGRLVENSSRNGWWRPDGWKVTTSIDAALALAERVLPGCNYSLYRDLTVQPDGKCWAYIQHVATDRGCPTSFSSGPSATPALALCIAILHATNQEQPNV
jgi:hypothetical protein